MVPVAGSNETGWLVVAALARKGRAGLLQPPWLESSGQACCSRPGSKEPGRLVAAALARKSRAGLLQPPWFERAGLCTNMITVCGRMYMRMYILHTVRVCTYLCMQVCM